MSLLRRLSSALWNCARVLLEPAEDPRRAFSDADERQRALLARVRQASIENAAAGELLAGRIARLRESLARVDERARRARANDREDLARAALQQRQIALRQIQSLESQLREIQMEGQRLAILDQRLAAQIQSLRIRREVIAARCAAAESQAEIGEAFAGLSGEFADLSLALEFSEQKVDYLQARASAYDHLLGDDAEGKPAPEMNL